MSLSDIQPNFALRGAIERWKLSNESVPSNDVVPLLINTKSFSISGYKTGTDMYLDIKTTHITPMETVLIAVLDVSGSMDSSANNNRQAEGDQFSRLDLVKHSMNTLANLLNSEYETTQSSLGIISFSNSASLVMPITKMDNVGLNTATTAISTLRTTGATNIWDGLRVALLQASTAIERNPNANIQILLLTDGEPTSDLLPPLGIKSTLKRKMDSLKGRVTISTFGFGYSLDADLLESICILGNGTYGFIPDCSMVGTVFINWAAKALLTLSHHITIELPDGQKHMIGDIVLGSSQTIVLPFTELENVKIIYDNGQEDTIPVIMSDEIGETSQNQIYLNRLRNEMEDIKKCKHYGLVVTQRILGLKSEIEGKDDSTEFMKDIVRDIESTDDSEGQIIKACSSDNWWSTWGRNHCISYYHALKLQQCVNFKDKVLQHFASDAFKALQEKGIDIFSALPAPTPSVRTYRSYYSGTAAGGLPVGGAYAPNPTVPVSMFDSSVRSFTIDMSNYVSNSGPCFTGDCKILMEDTHIKRVEDLKKGDRVWGGHKVLSVLCTPVLKEVDMVTFHTGLKITPWHPMKLKEDTEWVFPNDVGVTRKLWVEAYYNLALESGHIVELNGFQVVTLGHGFRDNDVISHPYFGTHAVIDDLKKHPDWEGGFLIMNPDNIVRSSETGMIQKI
jgi:Mg-chelatase subunit ChlD